MQDTIGAAIKQLRAEQNLTQYQLAMMVGVSDAMVAHIESGRRNLPEAMLGRIAKELQLDASKVASLEALRAEQAGSSASTKRADRLARLEAAVEALVDEQRAMRALLESRLPDPPDDRAAD